jgi:zinc transporter 1/2/3
MFEGLGLGSRLAVLPLPSRFNWVPYAGGVLYSCITPLGIAVGLGIRHAYDPESATASIVSGILDALAAGILIWTGMVELLAHDCAPPFFPSLDSRSLIIPGRAVIFNRAMAVEASNSKVAYAVSVPFAFACLDETHAQSHSICMFTGAGLMALLGRWA